jgi:hypothetical protein
MSSQSKIAAVDLRKVLEDILIGTTKRKFVSSTILLIIAFLIYVKNIKSGTDQLKIKLKDKDMKKVKNFI